MAKRQRELYRALVETGCVAVGELARYGRPRQTAPNGLMRRAAGYREAV